MRMTWKSTKFRVWLISMIIFFVMFWTGKMSEVGFIDVFKYSMGIVFVVNVAEKYVVGEKVKVDI